MKKELRKNMRKRLTKQQVLTIPNAITFLRLLLIPLFVYFYLHARPARTALVIALSMLSDVADGFIARRFHMGSDLGKMLDPVADKLTQAAMLLLLCSTYPLMWVLFALLAAKELTQLVLGALVLKKADHVRSAQWFGKIATVLLELTAFALLLLPDFPAVWANRLICANCGMVLFAFYCYARFYLAILLGRRDILHARPNLRRTCDGLTLACTLIGCVLLPEWWQPGLLALVLGTVCAACNIIIHARGALPRKRNEVSEK